MLDRGMVDSVVGLMQRRKQPCHDSLVSNTEITAIVQLHVMVVSCMPSRYLFDPR